MQPGETPQRPQPGRPSYGRRQMSVDGVFAGPARRPISGGVHNQRPPVLSRRPAAPSGIPMQPLQPTVPPIPPQPLQPELAPTPQPQTATQLPVPPPLPIERLPVPPAIPEPIVQDMPPAQPSSDFAPPEPTTPMIPQTWERKSFEPPKKQDKKPKDPSKPPKDHFKFLKDPAKRRILLRILAILAVIAIAAAVIFTIISWVAANGNSDKIFQKALGTSLGVKQVQVTTTDGQSNNQAALSFIGTNAPIASSQATVGQRGSEFGLKGYGNKQNTYFSYTKFPKTTNSQVTLAAQNGWVQVRSNGAEPAGVPYVVSNNIDPRYLAFGPVVFGNYQKKTKAQLLDFLIAHHVYKYDVKQVKRTIIGDTKVIAYPVTVDVGYLKVATISAASAEGLTPDDVQAATASFDAMKDAKATIYVTATGHHIVQFEYTTNGKKVVTAYTQYDTASIPDEPQTKVTWQNFASIQLQIETQAASHQTATQLDARRKQDINQLHTVLAAYYIQNNSYPTLANLNSPAWETANLGGVDPASLHDPVATTSSIGDTPKINSYAYQAVPASGKGVCGDSAANPCAHYKLTATLSNGQPYTVIDP